MKMILECVIRQIRLPVLYFMKRRIRLRVSWYYSWKRGKLHGEVASRFLDSTLHHTYKGVESLQIGRVDHSKPLVNEFGHFPDDTHSVFEHADHEELRTEAMLILKLAYKMGMGPTNIENHMGSMNHVPEILLELCERYNLPLRYSKELAHLGDITQHEEILKQAEENVILLQDSIKMLPFAPSNYPR